MLENPYWNLNLERVIPEAIGTILLAAVVAWVLSRGRSRRVKWLVYTLLAAMLVACPLSNWILWEPINKQRLTRMKEEAERVGLEGKTFEEIEALFGEPTFVWDYNGVTWNYQPTPVYFLGSKFQVHFKRGVVYGWEPYDD